MLPYRFSVKVEQEDLRRFNIYSFYHRPTGVLMTLIGVVMFCVAQYMFFCGKLEMKDEVFTTLLSLVVVVYMPLTLAMRAKSAMLRNPVFSQPMHYSLEEDGLHLSTEVDLGEGEERESSLLWKNIYKAVRTREELLIFSNQIHAFVIPMRDLGEKYSAIREILQNKLEPYQRGRL